jgi:hypothetical protein
MQGGAAFVPQSLTVEENRDWIDNKSTGKTGADGFVRAAISSKHLIKLSAYLPA